MKKTFNLKEILKAFKVTKEDELPWQSGDRGSFLRKKSSKGVWFIVKQADDEYLGLLTPNGTAADLE